MVRSIFDTNGIPYFSTRKVKNENDASEIGFPTLTTGAFPNQKFNKQTSHESKKAVDSSCISF